MIGLVSALSLALAACGKSGSATNTAVATASKPVVSPEAARLKGKFEITPANAESLFPHTEGSTWTYALEIQRQATGQAPASEEAEIVYKIDASKKTGDTTNFLLGIYQDGKKKDEQMWSSSPKGIFQNSVGPTRRAFDPPQPVVQFPVKIGDTFRWKGTSGASNGQRVPSSIEASAIGMQTVDTPMGDADALLVESVTTFQLRARNGQSVPAGSVTDSWLRPGIGIVRYRQSTQTPGIQVLYTLRLKSYKIG